MAAWHESRKPGLGSNAWLGIAFALYATAIAVLVGWILYRVLTPLP